MLKAPQPEGAPTLAAPSVMSTSTTEIKGEQIVSGELVRRTGAEMRQHVQDIDAVGRRAEVIHAQVAATGQVTRRALQETLYTNLERKQAEHLAPDGAEQYALIVWHGAMAMVRRIDALESGW